MNVIVNSLESILREPNLVITWENLELPTKQLIQSAIDSTSHPSCIVYPQTQTQLAEVMAIAHQHKWRVLTCGGGTKINWGGLDHRIDIIVSTIHINRLIEHAVGDLTVTVEAGIKFAQLQEILAKSNQAIALDPTTPTLATIGGIIATADTGSLRQRYGGVRDHLLGITFVRADGQIAKAGGRVVKNVAGYDLMKLFTGSYGTLGIISQATFRVYPCPEASRTVVLTGQPEFILLAIANLKASALTPTHADLLSLQLVSRLGLGESMGLIVRFQSVSESVEEQSNQFLAIAQKLGLDGTTYVGEDEVDLWRKLPEQIHSPAGDSVITGKIGVLPTAAVEILTQIELGLIHIGSGLGLVRLREEKEILALRQLCESHSGFLTVLAAPVTLKESLDVWGYSGNALNLMRGIKKQFDGNNILSPSRFVGGI
jgi:glycolate oxidase FAD binding subunit